MVVTIKCLSLISFAKINWRFAAIYDSRNGHDDHNDENDDDFGQNHSVMPLAHPRCLLTDLIFIHLHTLLHSRVVLGKAQFHYRPLRIHF